MTTALRVYASYHQFNLFETDAEDDLDDGDPRAGNGLVRVNADGDFVTVCTGVQNGYVRVDYDVLEGEPPPATGSWDEVVDISAVFEPPGAGITSPEGDGDGGGLDPEDAEYGIDLPGPEGEPRWWRLRIHARGRDTASEGDNLSERYLILVWPAGRAPEIRHKLTDRTGELFRTGR
ncbi:hypothetical protein ACT1U9_32525 [Streptomyces sp. BR1]|uniref:hypothetical protein n=1 Tax=Streptomyces sp. BR1 TaxID=1592323 RepID=UPI00402BC4D6